MLLKLYIYAYLNRIQSSRRLEREPDSPLPRRLRPIVNVGWFVSRGENIEKKC
jgi:hypothetical protein